MTADISGKQVFVVTEAIVEEGYGPERGSRVLDNSMHNAKVFSNVKAARKYMRERVKELYYTYVNYVDSSEDEREARHQKAMLLGFFFASCKMKSILGLTPLYVALNNQSNSNKVPQFVTQ